MRRLVWAVLGVLCVVTALALVALAILFTTPGQRWLQAKVLEQANEQLAGRVTLGKLDLRFGGRVQLRDLTLRDPAGNLVFHADLVEARIDPLAIASHRIALKDAHVAAPQLWLFPEPDGESSLAAALAPRHPKPKQPSTSSNPWQVSIASLELRNGLFDRRNDSNESGPLHVDQIALDGQALVEPGNVRVALRGSAQVTSPEQVPVSLAVNAHGTGFSLDDALTLSKLEVNAGASSVRASGALADGRAHATAEVQLDRAMGRALGVPLRTDLTAHLHANWARGEPATVALVVPSPPGSAQLLASIHPEEEPLQYQATLTLVQFDPGALLEPAPRGALDGTVALEGSGTSLAELEGDVSVALRASRLRGIEVDALDLRGRVANEQLTLSKLDAKLPGGEVHGSGTASRQALSLDLTANASQLEALTRNLGLKQPFSGSASARLHLGGSPAAPSLTVKATSPRIARPSMDFDLQQAEIEASIPNLREPRAIDSRLSVERAHFQGELFEGFRGTVDVNGARFDADLRSLGPTGITLVTSGAFADGQREVSLEKLVVGQGPQTWTLASPAQIDLSAGAHVDALELVSGPQRIVVHGGLTHRRFDLKLDVERVDLAALPALAVPRRLGLRGVVDGTAKVTGSSSDPQIDLHLGASGLTFAQLSNHTPQTATAALDAHLAGHRAKGNLDLTLEGETAHLQFEAPDSLRGQGPISGTLHVDHLNLARLAALLDRPELLAGKASLDASFGGTIAKPSAKVALQLHQVQVHQAPPVSGSLQLDVGALARLGVDLRTARGTLTGTAQLALPSDLIRHRERLAKLRTEPARVQLGLVGFDLDPWRTQFGIPPDADGVLDLTIQATGTPLDPKGTVRARIRNLVYGRVRAIDAAVQLDAGNERLALAASARAHDTAVLRLDGNLARSAGELIAHPEKLGTAPLQLTAAVGPLDLASTQGPKPRATGRVDATVALSGTLDAPVFHAHGSTRDLAFAGATMGTAEAAVDYQDGELRVLAELPHFDLHASAKARLGLDALRRGLAFREIPIEAKLVANHFDLGTLSGVSKSVSTLGGSLDADAQVQGKLGDPAFRGRLAVAEGKLVVAGVGDYRHIAIQLTADNQTVEISKLEVHSGDGSFHLAAKASRPDPSSPFELAGELHAEKFPVDSQDQTLAFVGADAKLEGHLARQSLVIVRFSHIRADVPKLTHKDVQSLEPNPDIVILGRTTRNTRVARARRAPGTAESGTEALQAERSAAEARPWQLKVGVFAPGDVLLRGPDINLDLQAQLGVLVQPGARHAVTMIPPPGSRAASQISAVRGWVAVLGRRFEVAPEKPARIEFSGGQPKNANLDVNMVYDDRADAIVVNVAVTGPLSKPNPPQLTSQPPLDESQLAMLIATGHLQAKRGAGTVNAGAEAGSVIGSILASAIQKEVASTLPIDTVSVQTNAQGQVSAQVGKYITNRIYVGYTRNFASQLSPGSLQLQDQNLDEFSLQYQISPHWQLEVVGGEVQGGIDAIWQKDF